MQSMSSRASSWTLMEDFFVQECCVHGTDLENHGPTSILCDDPLPIESIVQQLFNGMISSRATKEKLREILQDGVNVASLVSNVIQWRAACPALGLRRCGRMAGGCSPARRNIFPTYPHNLIRYLMGLSKTTQAFCNDVIIVQF